MYLLYTYVPELKNVWMECCAIITQYTISNSQMLTNVLVIHIHVTLMPTALTTLVVSHVTATQGTLEVVLPVKVRTYLIYI